MTMVEYFSKLSTKSKVKYILAFPLLVLLAPCTVLVMVGEYADRFRWCVAKKLFRWIEM